MLKKCEIVDLSSNVKIVASFSGVYERQFKFVSRKLSSGAKLNTLCVISRLCCRELRALLGMFGRFWAWFGISLPGINIGGFQSMLFTSRRIDIAILELIIIEQVGSDKNNAENR